MAGPAKLRCYRGRQLPREICRSGAGVTTFSNSTTAFVVCTSLQNLQSRVYYDKPADVKSYLLRQLLEIQKEREAKAAQLRILMEEGPSDSQSAPETPCWVQNHYGIFSDEDFLQYFRMLAGRGPRTVPYQRLCNGKKGVSSRLSGRTRATTISSVAGQDNALREAVAWRGCLSPCGNTS